MEPCQDLLRSYRDFENWPHSYVHWRPYCGQITHVRRRLKQEESRLLQTDSTAEICIQFRDRHVGQTRFVFTAVLNDEQLCSHLGDTSPIDKNKGILPASYSQSFTKIDPICRLIYLEADSSRHRLWVNKLCLTRLFTFHQVIPEYLDFMLLLGLQTRMADTIFSGFREQTCLKNHPQMLASPGIGRSGTHIEMAYVLRGVGKTERDASGDTGTLPQNEERHTRDQGHQSYSIRPAAFYHRYDVATGTILWVVTHGHPRLYEKFAKHTDESGRSCDLDFDSKEASFRTTLGVHCIWAQWASAQWVPYVKYLESRTEDQTGSLVYEQRERSPQRTRVLHRLKELAVLQYIEEQCNQAITAIAGNIDVLESISGHYQKVAADLGFRKVAEACAYELTAFERELRRCIGSLESDMKRTRHILSLLEGRKALVSQFIQSQTTERMESLTLSTREVAIESQHEASTVRIFTVVTLFFLPVTFVSTLFSADLFKFTAVDEPDGSDQFYKAGFAVWAIVSILLTIVVMATARWYYLRSHDKLAERKTNDTFYLLKDGEQDNDRITTTASPAPKLDRITWMIRFALPCALARWESRRSRSDKVELKDPEKGLGISLEGQAYRPSFPQPRDLFGTPPGQLYPPARVLSLL